MESALLNTILSGWASGAGNGWGLAGSLPWNPVAGILSGGEGTGRQLGPVEERLGRCASLKYYLSRVSRTFTEGCVFFSRCLDICDTDCSSNYETKPMSSHRLRHLPKTYRVWRAERRRRENCVRPPWLPFPKSQHGWAQHEDNFFQGNVRHFF